MPLIVGLLKLGSNVVILDDQKDLRQECHCSCFSEQRRGGTFFFMHTVVSKPLIPTQKMQTVLFIFFVYLLGF